MKHTIKNDLGEAIINTNGAYIDSFIMDGSYIFFPKVMVKIDGKLKIRGGMHLCAPNFGHDTLTGKLGSHGFARDLAWQALDTSPTSISLSLEGTGEFEQVNFSLTYKLEGTSLFASLRVVNSSKKELPLAPGFHPYFYSDHQQVAINGGEIDPEILPSSIYKQEKSKQFIANGNNIEVLGHTNINEFVLWTDFKGNYICVEPTYAGNAFEDSSKSPYILKPNGEFIQEIEIKINL